MIEHFKLNMTPGSDLKGSKTNPQRLTHRHKMGLLNDLGG
jgi:hypothetical protein